MKTFTAFSASLTSILTANAATISFRQAPVGFTYDCNGQQNPDVQACGDLLEGLRQNAATTEYRCPPGANIISYNLGESSNCQLDITFSNVDYIVGGPEVIVGLEIIEKYCLPQGQGGYANDNGGSYSIGLRNNPTYKPPTKARSIRAEKRADDDTSFELYGHRINSKPASMKHNIGDGLVGGSTWEWTKEKSVTDTTTTSASLSATIEEIVGLSIGTEISSSETTTSGEATTFTIDCATNEVGQVYFQGYAEEWEGTLQPSGDNLIVTKPQVNSDGATAGYYAYDCFPK